MIYILKGNKNYAFRNININTHIDGTISYDIMGKEIEVDVFKGKEVKLEKIAV